MRENHLDKPTIIRAVVDATDLNKAEQDHLSKCEKCQSRVKLFSLELDMLGQRAIEASPVRLRKPVLPELGIGKFKLFKPIFAASLLSIMAVMVLLWPNNGTLVEKKVTAEILQEMEADEKFMSDLDSLELTAQTGLYMELSEDSEQFVEDEFIDFLVPLENGSVI